MEKRKKKVRRVRRVRKDRIAILIAFLSFTIMCGTFLVKVAGPTNDMFWAQDDYIRIQKYGNPLNWKARNEAYNQYVEVVQTYTNSEDKVVAFYAKQDGTIKFLMIVTAIIPCVVTAGFILSSDKEDKKRNKHGSNSPRKNLA